MHTYFSLAEILSQRLALAFAGLRHAALFFPMARPRKFSGEDETRGLETHSVRYYVADLQKLERLSKVSGILPGVWLRQCLHELVEAFDRDGTVSVPFVIVARNAAEKAGLVPPLPPEPPRETPTKIRG